MYLGFLQDLTVNQMCVQVKQLDFTLTHQAREIELTGEIVKKLLLTFTFERKTRDG